MEYKWKKERGKQGEKRGEDSGAYRSNSSGQSDSDMNDVLVSSHGVFERVCGCPEDLSVVGE